MRKKKILRKKQLRRSGEGKKEDEENAVEECRQRKRKWDEEEPRGSKVKQNC